MTSARTYEELVSEALQAQFSGWDFGWLRDRAAGGDPTWSYEDRARTLLAAARSLLDVDTGGGERLASLAPLPPHAVATEGWEPNVALARDRLRPLGVDVRRTAGDRLPAEDDEFDLVLNRHGSLDPAELARVLAPGGVLLTQQVGSRNSLDLNEALDAPPGSDPDSETLETAVVQLEAHGFRIVDAREEMPEHVFYDIGAVVYQLRAVPWQVPDFDVTGYDAALRRLDAQIRADGRFVAHDHRYLVEAVAG